METVKIINFIHWILVIGLIGSVFVDNHQWKKLALTLLIFILAQFMTNYGKCGLTELEYLFKGEKYQEGFIYKTVKPIITVPENYFNNLLYIFHILWIGILWKQLTKA
jgi:hypothetical protein